MSKPNPSGTAAKILAVQSKWSAQGTERERILSLEAVVGETGEWHDHGLGIDKSLWWPVWR